MTSPGSFASGGQVMTATQPRGRKVQKVASRGRHPASSVAQNGRGPRRFVGATTRVYVVLLLTVMALVLLGTVMVLSASAPESVADTDSAWSLFWHQLRWVGLGLLAMTISKQIDYHLLRVFSKPLMIGSVLLLIAVLLPGVGASANGATRSVGLRWISDAALGTREVRRGALCGGTAVEIDAAYGQPGDHCATDCRRHLTFVFPAASPAPSRGDPRHRCNCPDDVVPRRCPARSHGGYGERRRARGRPDGMAHAVAPRPVVRLSRPDL